MTKEEVEIWNTLKDIEEDLNNIKERVIKLETKQLKKDENN